MNVGMIVLVGCVLGSGAIAYRGTTGGAAPAATPIVDGAPHSTPRVTAVIEPTVAQRTTTPVPSTQTPSPTPYPKLTLDQVRGLARPPAVRAGAPAGPPVSNAPRQAAVPASPSLEPPALAVPAATTLPESGAPPPAATPPPVANTTPPPVLATPPPLPPMPEGIGPRSAPTETPR